MLKERDRWAMRSRWTKWDKKSALITQLCVYHFLQTLAILDVRWNAIRDEGARALADARAINEVSSLSRSESILNILVSI